MSGPIRSACVARGTLPSDALVHVVYTVPSGYALLLKSLSLVATAGPASFPVWLNSPGGTVAVIVTNIALELNKPAFVDGWWVLNGGDYISANASGGNVSYWISGAVLPFAVMGPAAADQDLVAGLGDTPLPASYDPSSAEQRSPISI